jgi:hypothetical protein
MNSMRNTNGAVGLRTPLTCHPERRRGFANANPRRSRRTPYSCSLKRRRREFSPVSGLGEEFPDASVQRMENAGSFDCVVVRFADDHFARDDSAPSFFHRKIV